MYDTDPLPEATNCTSAFTVLPTELLISVLEDLDTDSLINMAATSTRYRSMIMPEVFRDLTWDLWSQWTGMSFEPQRPTMFARILRMSLVALTATSGFETEPLEPRYIQGRMTGLFAPSYIESLVQNVYIGPKYAVFVSRSFAYL